MALGALLVAGTIALGLTPVFRAIVPLGVFRMLAFVAAPFVTAFAAVLYRWAVRGLDEFMGVPLLPTVRAGWEVLPLAPTLGVTAVGLLAAVGGSFALSHVMVWLGVPVEEQAGILAVIAEAKESGSWANVGALAISAVLFAPAAEEWLFRGLLFRRIAGQTHPIEGLILSGLAFALIHDNWAGFVVYFWLGSVFAVTYWRTGHLWAAIVVHASNNALALAGLVFSDGS